jgi:hypothetical protein
MRDVNRQRGFLAVPALGATGYMVVAGIALVVILSAVAYIVYKIDDGGYRRAQNKFEPQVKAMRLERDVVASERDEARAANARLADDLGTLKRTYGEQQAALDKAKADALQAEIELRKTLVKFAASEKRWTAEIRRLVEIANSPVITEGILEETDVILRSLARDRAERLRH